MTWQRRQRQTRTLQGIQKSRQLQRQVANVVYFGLSAQPRCPRSTPRHSPQPLPQTLHYFTSRHTVTGPQRTLFQILSSAPPPPQPGLPGFTLAGSHVCTHPCRLLQRIPVVLISHAATLHCACPARRCAHLLDNTDPRSTLNGACLHHFLFGAGGGGAMLGSGACARHHSHQQPHTSHTRPHHSH